MPWQRTPPLPDSDPMPGTNQGAHGEQEGEQEQDTGNEGVVANVPQEGVVEE